MVPWPVSTIRRIYDKFFFSSRLLLFFLVYVLGEFSWWKLCYFVNPLILFVGSFPSLLSLSFGVVGSEFCVYLLLIFSWTSLFTILCFFPYCDMLIYLSGTYWIWSFFLVLLYFSLVLLDFIFSWFIGFHIFLVLLDLFFLVLVDLFLFFLVLFDYFF